MELVIRDATEKGNFFLPEGIVVAVKCHKDDVRNAIRDAIRDDIRDGVSHKVCHNRSQNLMSLKRPETFKPITIRYPKNGCRVDRLKVMD